MTDAKPPPWTRAEEAAEVESLKAAIATADQRLERYIRRQGGVAAAEPAPLAGPADGSAIERLTSGLELSDFERDLLLLCAGAQLTAQTPQLCALAHRDPAKPYMTLTLARAALPDGSRLDVGAAAALLGWGLVEFDGAAGPDTPLRCPAPVIAFLLGAPRLDDRLSALVTLVQTPVALGASQAKLADMLADVMAHAPARPCLVGSETTALAIAAAAAHALDLSLFWVSSALLPADPVELLRLARLWRRDRILTGAALALALEEDGASALNRPALLRRFLLEAGGVLVILGPGAGGFAAEDADDWLRFDVPPITPAEASAIFRGIAAGAVEPAVLDALAEQSSLSPRTFAACLAATLAEADTTADQRGARLLARCRQQGRSRLEGLAQRLTPRAGLEDLILPEPLLAILRQAVARHRNAGKVFGEWGFEGGDARGRALSLLFAGSSGTGKTMAAEALAKTLDLDLFRIDLSAVVDKYIGETEKNLRRLFDAADAMGAVLLFDEADALFGKRSDVRDSRDRHANIEVSYLLQRLETYRGVAVLTSNLPAAIDQAFQRRLTFILQFPFPDETARRAIWRRAIPARAPVETLSFEALARLALSGGQIRNIALNAAMLAADQDAPVSMGHLAAALGVERDKQGRPLAPAEMKGWPS